MAIREELDRLLDDVENEAAFVLGHAGASAIDPGLIADITRDLDAVRAAARAPVRVGLAAEYSTGKSVLLSVLLGRPDLLPAKRRATTGVLTEIRPRIVPDPGPVGTAEVHFLGVEAVGRYRDLLVGRLAAEAARRSLPAPPPGDDWAGLAAWCRTHLWRVDGMGAVILELLALRDAVARHPGTAGAPPVTASWDEVRDKVLTIPATAGGEPEWDLRSLPPGAPADPLRGAARLVERVVIDVEVHPRDWPPDRAQFPDDVVLLDTPGRGGAPTQVRDAMLLRDEFPRLDALVVLLRPVKPDSAAFHEIRREYARAGGRDVTSVINIFAELTSWSEQLERGAGPLRPSDVLEHPDHQDLRAAWTLATDGKARAAITDVAAAWALGAPGPAPVPHPQDRGETEWRGALLRGVTAWRTIGGRVEPGGDALSEALSQYGRDGGLHHLRTLVTRQASANGLDRKLARVQALVEAFRPRIHRAERELSRWQATVASAVVRERQELNGLLDRRAVDELKITWDRCMVDLLSTRFELDAGHTGMAAARAHAVTAVFDWTCWQELWDMNSSRDRRTRLEAIGVPIRSDELAPAFEETVESVRRQCETLADDMVWEWLDRRHEELAPVFGEAVKAIGAVPGRLGEEHQPVLDWMAKALQTRWLFDEPAREPADPPVGDRFPLRRASTLPWASGDDAARHEINIARVRNELAAAVERAACTALNRRLRARVRGIEAALATTVNQRHRLDRRAFLEAAYPSAAPALPEQPRRHRNTTIEGLTK